MKAGDLGPVTLLGIFAGWEGSLGWAGVGHWAAASQPAAILGELGASYPASSQRASQPASLGWAGVGHWADAN